MVAVLPGSFTMGSPPSEPGRAVDEGPEHLVTLAKPFAVGVFAVTFDQWDAGEAERPAAATSLRTLASAAAACR